MDGVSRSRHCKGLSLKISVITGWQVPNNEEYVTILDDQLYKKAVDEWAAINFDELEYAIRTYGTGIKDWGKLLNLALIDECVTQYMDERVRLSEIEERLRVNESRYETDQQTGQRSRLKELIDSAPVDWSEEWKNIVNKAKNNQISEAVIIVPIYDWLFRMKMVTIPGPDRWEIVEQCRLQFIAEMEEALSTLIEKPHIALEKIRRLRADNWLEDDEMKSLVFNMGKIETVRQLAIMEAAKDL